MSQTHQETMKLLRALLAKLDIDDNVNEVQPVVTLQSVLDELLAISDPAKVTADQYKRGLKFFEEFLGRPATSDDLTHDNLNAWFTSLQANRKNGPKTVRGHRAAICRIWNHLSQDGVIQPYLVRKLRLPKLTQKIVESWTKPQVECLLKAADASPGRLRCGMPTRLFFRALLLVAYDSGLRPNDLRRLKWTDIDFGKCLVVIVQHKTGNPHCFSLSEESIAAVKMIIEPRRELVFPLSKDGTDRQLRKLFAAAKAFGFTRKKGQSIAMMRKLHATEVFKQHGLNAAAESLGHVSGSGIAKRHYVDSSAQHVGNLPPRLSQ